MKRCAVLVVTAVLAGGVVSALSAQKAPPSSTQRPTPAPSAAPTGPKRPPGQGGAQPAPQPPATQPSQAQPPAAPPAGAQPTGAQPAGAQPGAAPANAEPTGPVTPQAARPASGAGAGAAAGASTGTYTSGLAMPPYTGSTTAEAWEYAGRLGRMLDSAIVTLIGTFRNTSGQPMIGASSPATLSTRERDRWARCRNLYWDLTTYASAVGSLRQAVGPDPALQHAVADLDSAFAKSRAVEECDNLASMIDAPGRWTPWQDYYEEAARHFYRDFYAQIREVHERDRALISGLNRFLPPGRRVTPLPGLPANPPYAGAGPS